MVTDTEENKVVTNEEETEEQGLPSEALAEEGRTDGRVFERFTDAARIGRCRRGAGHRGRTRTRLRRPASLWYGHHLRARIPLRPRVSEECEHRRHGDRKGRRHGQRG